MSDTESNHQYPDLPNNLFDTPIEYQELEVPEEISTLIPLSCPKTPIMAPESSSSGKSPMFSFLAQVNKTTQVKVKLDNIGKLTGQENYWIWSASMTVILKGIKAYKIVVDGVSPAEDADNTEVDVYDHLCHTASTIIIKVVSQDILEKIVELEKPHLMWTWLCTIYYGDSAYALVSQIRNLVSLPT